MTTLRQYDSDGNLSGSVEVTPYRKQINVPGAGECIAYARTAGTMWYNGENPDGRAFEPVSGEDINNYNDTLEYGEKLTRGE